MWMGEFMTGRTAKFAALPTFRSIGGLENVLVAERGNLRCMAIALTGGGFCLFSPVKGLGETASEQLPAVRALLAPNHYHNNGLKKHVGMFPDACLCAPDDAIPRLRRVTGLTFDTPARREAELPANVTIVRPLGLKNGEIWLRVLGVGHTAWVVVDAFCGAVSRTARTASDPALLKTFPRFRIGKRADYVDWLDEQLSADAPTMIVPCHGAIVVYRHLVARLRGLMTLRP